MNRLLKVITLLRYTGTDREFPIQLLQVLIYIASRDGCHKTALQDKDIGIDITPASASRNTDWLSKDHRLGKRGLDLIEKRTDPTHSRMRRQTLHLTKKGEYLVQQIKDILYE